MIEYNDDYNKLIKSIVKKVKQRFQKFTLVDDDLSQRGWLELITAYFSFDETMGIKFTTYSYQRVFRGIMAEAVSEINSGTVNSEKLSNVIYLDEAELDIVDENVYEFDEDGSCEKLMGLVRQNLSQDEFKLLCCAYGIDCKQCSDPKKLAKQFGLTELEVKRLIESGKRKLRELYGRG